MQHRVRLHWHGIAAALAMLREGAEGQYRATIEGNFPVIDCATQRDVLAVAEAISGARYAQEDEL